VPLISLRTSTQHRQNYEPWAFAANDSIQLLLGLMQGLSSMDFLIFLKPTGLPSDEVLPPAVNSDGEEDDYDSFNSFLDSVAGRRLSVAISAYACVNVLLDWSGR